MSRLEDNFDAMKTALNEVRLSIARIDAKLDASVGRLEAKFDATIPDLATKDQIAKLPTRGYLGGVLGVLIACIYGGFGAALDAYSVLH